MSYERPFRYYLLKARPPWTKTAVYGPSTRPSVHVDNGPKFVLRPSISWTNLDAGPRLSFEGGRMDIFFYHGLWTSWTNSDAGPKLSFWGRRVDRFLTMDRRLHGRIRTIKKSTRWTEVDGQTDETDRWMDERSTNYFPWRLYSINGWGLGKFEIRVEGKF